MNGFQMDGEVRMDPMPPVRGREVKIFYAGPLAESGQEPLYVYVNYSTPASIEASRRVLMTREEPGFCAAFAAEQEERMRFYFRSQDGNVDDNQGEGWETTLVDS